MESPTVADVMRNKNTHNPVTQSKTGMSEPIFEHSTDARKNQIPHTQNAVVPSKRGLSMSVPCVRLLSESNNAHTTNVNRASDDGVNTSKESEHAAPQSVLGIMKYMRKSTDDQENALNASSNIATQIASNTSPVVKNNAQSTNDDGAPLDSVTASRDATSSLQVPLTSSMTTAVSVPTATNERVFQSASDCSSALSTGHFSGAVRDTSIQKDNSLNVLPVSPEFGALPGFAEIASLSSQLPSETPIVLSYSSSSFLASRIAGKQGYIGSPSIFAVSPRFSPKLASISLSPHTMSVANSPLATPSFALPSPSLSSLPKNSLDNQSRASPRITPFNSSKLAPAHLSRADGVHNSIFPNFSTTHIPSSPGFSIFLRSPALPFLGASRTTSGDIKSFSLKDDVESPNLPNGTLSMNHLKQRHSMQPNNDNFKRQRRDDNDTHMLAGSPDYYHRFRHGFVAAGSMPIMSPTFLPNVSPRLNGMLPNSPDSSPSPAFALGNAPDALLEASQFLDPCCHHCYKTRRDVKLAHCSHTFSNEQGHFICSKRYCHACLQIFYKDAAPDEAYDIMDQSENNSDWSCPSCIGCCCCLSCVQQRGGRQDFATLNTHALIAMALVYCKDELYTLMRSDSHPLIVMTPLAATHLADKKPIFKQPLPLADFASMSRTQENSSRSPPNGSLPNMKNNSVSACTPFDSRRFAGEDHAFSSTKAMSTSFSSRRTGRPPKALRKQPMTQPMASDFSSNAFAAVSFSGPTSRHSDSSPAFVAAAATRNSSASNLVPTGNVTSFTGSSTTPTSIQASSVGLVRERSLPVADVHLSSSTSSSSSVVPADRDSSHTHCYSQVFHPSTSTATVPGVFRTSSQGWIWSDEYGREFLFNENTRTYTQIAGIPAAAARQASNAAEPVQSSSSLGKSISNSTAHTNDSHVARPNVDVVSCPTADQRGMPVNGSPTQARSSSASVAATVAVK